MNILDLFRPRAGVVPGIAPGGQGALIASPWSGSSTITQVTVASEVFGASATYATREQALQVPSLLKARNLICENIAKNPLEAWRGTDKLPDRNQPTFLYRTNSGFGPYMRMLMTVDDLMWSGFSLWAVVRGSDNSILDGVRVDPRLWQFDIAGAVQVRTSLTGEWYYPADGAVILFTGPHEGILKLGSRQIRAAIDLDDAWIKRVKYPIPVVELHSRDANNPASPAEVKQATKDYLNARRSEEGALTYTPASLELITHGDKATDLYESGRNALVLDFARMTGIPATMLDASQVTGSLTYKTDETSRNGFIDLSLDMWANPIKDRLSQDDVVPRGQRVEFNRANMLSVPAPATGPATQD
jgi:hypothetical protein